MKIIRDNKAATFTLVPVDKSERAVFGHLIPKLKNGDTFTYGGREDDGEYCKVRLHFGSKMVEKVERVGGITVHRGVEEGGICLVLNGSTKKDKLEVGGMRNSCYFGACSPIFLKTTKVSGVKSLVITLKLCKHCKAPMISMHACEWSTCNACAEKCQHTYKKGMVHGAGVGDMAVGEFCTKCGRGKPLTGNEPKKTQAQRHLDVERELGVHVMYHNSSATPSQIVAAEKAAGVIPTK